MATIDKINDQPPKVESVTVTFTREELAALVVLLGASAGTEPLFTIYTALESTLPIKEAAEYFTALSGGSLRTIEKG